MISEQERVARLLCMGAGHKEHEPSRSHNVWRWQDYLDDARALIEARRTVWNHGGEYAKPRRRRPK